MVTMDFNDESRTQSLYGGTILLIVLATVAVIARLAARKASVAGLWWDDMVIVFALILDWGLSSCYWIEVKLGGLGHHTVAVGGPVDQRKQQKFYEIFPAIQILYFASSFAIKTSLLLLYHRIFGVVRWFRRLLIIVWAIALLYFVVFFFVTLFECRPVAFYWDKSIRGGTCIDQKQFYRWNGIINLLIDFAIWSLTFPMIWRLKLSRRQKLSISAVFLLGLLACAASIVRVVAFDLIDFNDITFTLVTASIWTTVEQSIGIICACLPTTRPLFGRLLSSMKRGDKRNSSDANPFDAIPLPNYSPRQTSERSFDAPNRTGFARLESGNTLEGGSGTTSTDKVSDDILPAVPQRSVRQQRPKQDFENGI